MKICKQNRMLRKLPPGGNGARRFQCNEDRGAPLVVKVAWRLLCFFCGDYFDIFQEDGMYVLEGVANWKSFKKDKCRKM